MQIRDPEETPQPVSLTRPLRQRLWLPLCVLATGVVLIALAERFDAKTFGHHLWGNALLAPDSPLPEHEAEGVIPVAVRRLPEEDPGQIGRLLKGLEPEPLREELLAILPIDKGPRVVRVSLPPAELQPLLASGRTPRAGTRDALAGDLVRGDTFAMDGETFHVVGRLQRSVSGLGYAFVVLDSDLVRSHFALDSGATHGWIDPEGLLRIAAGQPPFDTDDFPEVVGGFARTRPLVVAASIFGLILVAVGGALMQYRILHWLAPRHDGALNHVLAELAARPRLVFVVHVALYGVFFVCMAAAYAYPVVNFNLADYVQGEFAEGNLSYIGSAYASGDVLRASAATFLHNFLTATVAFTILPSLIIPFAGLIKNLLTFSVVGFVMAPIWTGTAAQLTYHAITMTLELEAYIVASFVVAVLPLRIARGLASGGFGSQVLQGLRVMAGGTLLAGLMLALAALYEAATILLIGPW